MLEGALSGPIETKCLLYVNARSMVITDQLALTYIRHLVTIGRIYPRGGELRNLIVQRNIIVPHYTQRTNNLALKQNLLHFIGSLKTKVSFSSVTASS